MVLQTTLIGQHTMLSGIGTVLAGQPHCPCAHKIPGRTNE